MDAPNINAGTRWLLDGVEVVVEAVKKKGRGYYIAWADAPQPYTTERTTGRTPLKVWQKKATPV
jgi:hypothetical protein